MRTEERDLWTCPRCGARFVTRNMSHGCGDYTVDGFFEGKPATARELYDAFVRFVGEIGAFEVGADQDADRVHGAGEVSRP